MLVFSHRLFCLFVDFVQIDLHYSFFESEHFYSMQGFETHSFFSCITSSSLFTAEAIPLYKYTIICLSTHLLVESYSQVAVIKNKAAVSIQGKIVFTGKYLPQMPR
jgi:hypothetical protein